MLTGLILFFVALLAGFVDAIAGGGGLLTLPALLQLNLPPQLTLGTNKGQSVFGSGTSLLRYWRSPLLDKLRVEESFAAGVAGAVFGVWLVSKVSPQVLRPLVMFLLAAVAVVMLVRRNGIAHGPPRQRPWWMVVGVAFLIATYDGFFGPGTGTFLIMIYSTFWRESLDQASANAKVVNFASNLGSIAVFAAKGLVLWKLALPMAAGQIIGGWTGAHVTIRAGRGLVRYAVIAISIALILRLAWQMTH